MAIRCLRVIALDTPLEPANAVYMTFAIDNYRTVICPERERPRDRILPD